MWTYFFYPNADFDYDFVTGSEARYTLYLAEEKLQRCPRNAIKNVKELVSARLDTGCDLTLVNENLYEKINQRETNTLNFQRNTSH
jgi:hypothetical protein